MNGQEVKFNVYDNLKYPTDVENCSMIRVLGELVTDSFEQKMQEKHTKIYAQSDSL